MSQFRDVRGVVSTVNSSSTPLISGGTFTGTAEEVLDYSMITVICHSDVISNIDGLKLQLSTNGTNWDRSKNVTTRTNTDTGSGFMATHTLSVVAKYFRVLYTNGATTQSEFRLQTIFHTAKSKALSSSLDTDIDSQADVELTRSSIMGQLGNGNYKSVPVSSEGHLEVEIHGPRNPFGSIHTENLTPEFQVDGVYGINPLQNLTTTSLTGYATGTSNLLKVGTGTTIYSSGVLQSRKRIRYRPGQGIVSRFTGIYSAPVASSLIVQGIGTSESGCYFGYNGINFGILHVTGGVREIRTLTITTKSTTTTDIVITLNGTPFTVTGITNSANIHQTAYEISKGTFTGWTANAVDGTVVFLSSSAGAKTGSYSLSQATGSPAVGTFAQTLAGVASTDTWYLQTAWNVDKMDGYGPSGINLVPQTGNIYQINVQYLGFGAITFMIETSNEGNNPIFNTVHTLNFPNSRTSINLSQPSMPFTMVAYSAGSTTDVWVGTGSYAGFIEGQKKLTGGRFSYDIIGASIGSTAGTYYTLATIRNSYTYKTRANQSIVNLLSINGSNEHTQAVTIYLLRNATLLGPTDFEAFSTTSATSIDTTSTTCTISDNNQLIFSTKLSKSGTTDRAFVDEISLQPGETITIAARTTGGTASNVVFVSLNTREDQ